MKIFYHHWTDSSSIRTRNLIDFCLRRIFCQLIGIVAIHIEMSTMTLEEVHFLFETVSKIDKKRWTVTFRRKKYLLSRMSRSWTQEYSHAVIDQRRGESPRYKKIVTDRFRWYLITYGPPFSTGFTIALSLSYVHVSFSPHEAIRSSTFSLNGTF